MTLIQILKTLQAVQFVECRDGYLWYAAICNPAWSQFFRIPLEDTVGAVFPRDDYENPRYYQRWIRKEMELQQAEAAAIAKAKAEWDPNA